VLADILKESLLLAWGFPVPGLIAPLAMVRWLAGSLGH